MASKLWGRRKFWGVGSEFDPDWNYDEEQIILRNKLIEVCRTKIRPFAVKSDQTYEYPKGSLQALAELGLMGLITPKEFGGLGQSHVGIVMVLETLARYGCPSTAMIYAMHIQATGILLLRYHGNEEIKTLLRRICCEGLVGTTSYSDPATGGHFWFPLTAKSQKVDENHYKVYRFNSWTTSAGFADFYIFQTPTPDTGSDYSDLTNFFVFKDEIRASTDDWSALGLHGNQSGPLIFEGILHKSRMIGKPGEGRQSNDEVGAPFFFISTTSVWNGIAFGCIDLAKRHTTQKTHGDTGLRVADYPIIQDYIGGSICKTNSSRVFVLSLAAQFDKLTNKNDWVLHNNPEFMPRSDYGIWMMHAKHNAAENVSRVADQMLKACGGDGYKADLGLERLLRDAKAGCVMALTNEVIRSIIGKGSLNGLDSLDLWGKTFSYQTIRNELNKMTLDEKKELLESITEDINREQKGKPDELAYQGSNFDNPFNLAPPKCIEAYKTPDGVDHGPALHPKEWKWLTLISKEELNPTMVTFIFAFPNNTDHSGCLPGQYIQIRLKSEGKYHERFFSPISPPNQFGSIELVLKLETNGIVSNIFQELPIGEKVEFRGPSGGFEYESNNLDELTVVASGSGVAPGLQLIRSIVMTPEDKVKITLIYHSKNVEEMIYQDKFEEIAKSDSRIKIVLTVLEAPEQWEHEEGFVDQEMLKKIVEKKNEKKHKILMCGGSTMTISCLHSLRSLRFLPDQIFIYGQFGTAQVRAVFGRSAKLSGHTSYDMY